MEDLRRQLQCRACKRPMLPPILVCKSMESVCQECRKKNERCPLCNKKFTNQHNEALEALANVPCFNCTRCGSSLALVEVQEHSKICLQKIKCPIEKCQWIGGRTEIVDHWRSKKITLRPFSDNNISKMKVNKYSYFANLVEAHESTFFFKSMCIDGNIFWALQYVGDFQQVKQSSYEIEIFNPIRLGCKFVLSDYCQSIELKNADLFKVGVCIYTPKQLISSYLIDDEVLYNFRVIVVDQATEEKNRKRVQKLLEKYSKKAS